MNCAVISHFGFTFVFATVFSSWLAFLGDRRICVRVLPMNTIPPCRWPGFFLCASMAGNETGQPPQGSTRTSSNARTGPLKTRWSVAGDWLAPLIVWGLVIALGLATASLLLGER